jgi:predicted nucleic acid-binding protein
MIVDTTFLIDLEREATRGREGPAMAFLAEHPAEILRISAVTYGELAEGYADPLAPELAELVAPYLVVDVTRSIGGRYGVISRAMRASGERWGDNDLWIAATALESNDAVVTRDAQHFGRIAGLKVHGY